MGVEDAVLCGAGNLSQVCPDLMFVEVKFSVLLTLGTEFKDDISLTLYSYLPFEITT